jgi:hypothetical protein
MGAKFAAVNVYDFHQPSYYRFNPASVAGGTCIFFAITIDREGFGNDPIKPIGRRN